MTQPTRKTSQESSDRDVGYGSPPVHSRFQPGRSGNPKGRPKRVKNLKTDVQKELAERVNITENGRPLKLSKQRLMLKAMTAKAVKGDTRAAALFINLIAQTFGLDTQEEARSTLSPDDEAILADWMARQVGAEGKTNGVKTVQELADDQ